MPYYSLFKASPVESGWIKCSESGCAVSELIDAKSELIKSG